MISFQTFVVASLAALAVHLCLAQNNVENKKTFLTSKETGSRTIEGGGTGRSEAIMSSDESLPIHTVFRPKDLGQFGENVILPIVVWGNGACANSPWEHVNLRILELLVTAKKRSISDLGISKWRKAFDGFRIRRLIKRRIVFGQTPRAAGSVQPAASARIQAVDRISSEACNPLIEKATAERKGAGERLVKSCPMRR